MRLVCLNGFNNTRFACQDFKRESFSLTHMPGSPQPSVCWRIWTCVQKKQYHWWMFAVMCCFWVTHVSCLFPFFQETPSSVFLVMEVNIKHVFTPLSFASHVHSCFCHVVTVCLICHGYAFNTTQHCSLWRRNKHTEEAKLKISVQGKLCSKTISGALISTIFGV